MKFGVLGRLEVTGDDGRPVQVSGPARRLVLAAMLCRAGSVVTASALIDDLWGADSPRSALGTLRSHVARLRDDLGRDAGGVLSTEGNGYRLTIGADELDAAEFEALVRRANQADPDDALRLYDQALALWRGEAYLEFGEAAFAVTERIRLAELRAYARERRTDLALAAGRTGELVAELEQRVHDEPYRERGWEQLALTLYRSGRQAEALDACRRARAVLVEDLGVEPGTGLATLQERLLRQDPALVATRAPSVPVIDRCPYLGLAGYDEGDAALFVGRERLTSVLAGRLSDQSVLVVTGASGVGKSSLIRAGLVPALRAGALPGSASWRIDVRTPADGLPQSHRTPDLLVVDQAEELFTSLDPEQADAFAAQLVDAVDAGGRVALVLRSDFYGRLADRGSLAPFADKSAVLIGPLRPDELQRALVEPAAAAGLRLEPDLLEAIMADVTGQAEPLPLLSEAMVRTWQNRADGVLTLEGYRRAGELAGALEAAAEECFARLDESSRTAARHLLVRMATRSGTTWIGRPLARTALVPTDAEQGALDALVAARLVTVAEHRVEIAHDALLEHWARLRGWLDERALAADLVEHLDQSATAWRIAGQQPGDLYRGARLTAALEWRADHPEDVSPEESEFLDAAARAADAELSEARDRAAREARGRRRLRYIATGLAAMVILAVTGGAIALNERSTARAQTKRAKQAALAADARRLSALSADAPDIATATLLAAAAYKLQDTADTEGALLAAVERSESALFQITTEFRPQQVLVSPDGRRIYAIDQQRHVDVYDSVTRQRITRYLARATYLSGLASNGTQLVVSGRVPGNDDPGDHRISILSSADGSTVRVLTTDMEPESGWPQTTSDGRWLGAVLSGKPEHFAVYSAANWSAAPREIAIGAPVNGLAAGTSSFAILLQDGTIETVDAATGRITHQVRRPDLASTDTGDPFAVSPAGTQVAFSSTDGVTPLLLDLGRPTAQPVRLPAQSAGIGTLAFAPGGKEIGVASQTGSVAVYATSDGAAVSSFKGHSGAVHGMAWVGTTRPTALYTSGLDSQIISWNLATAPRLLRRSGPVVPLPDHAEAFGTLLVGATPNQGNGPGDGPEDIYALDTTTGKYRSWPLGPTADVYVNQTVASADGHYALVSIQDPHTDWTNHIEIWDLRRGAKIGTLHIPAASVAFFAGLNAAISPDGKVAVCSLDATSVGVFDLPSGRLLRNYPVRFAPPDANRVTVVPWQFDPAGHLLLAGFDSGPPQAAPPGGGSDKPANAANQRFALMDVTTGHILAQTGLGDIVAPSALAWSRDGKLLALGTRVGTLKLYDAATLRQVADAGPVVPGYVLSASFSPDNRSLVVGDTGGEMTVFTVPDLSREGTAIQFTDAPSGWWFAFYNSAGDIDGLAPSGPDGGSSQWFTFPGRSSELLATACQLAGTDITPAQWTRYVGDQPYQHVCPSR